MGRLSLPVCCFFVNSSNALQEATCSACRTVRLEGNAAVTAPRNQLRPLATMMAARVHGLSILLRLRRVSRGLDLTLLRRCWLYVAVAPDGG